LPQLVRFHGFESRKHSHASSVLAADWSVCEMKIELGPITSDVYQAELLEILASYLEELITAQENHWCAKNRDAYEAVLLARGAAFDGKVVKIKELTDEVCEHINDANTENPLLVFGSFNTGKSTYGWQLVESV
jgi:hypothetical protein